MVDKLEEFVLKSKQLIIPEKFLVHITDFCEKENLNCLPCMQYESGYVVSALKDFKVGITEEEQASIEREGQFYCLLMDKSFKVQMLPFDFSYVPLSDVEEVLF